ncbi:hypothetical protein SLEP1_g25886 [Rubroshorea leprosula]|uniref:GAG-pre-integrase domain-containing protein n=1 Tax=Rubroshorea leprosula TaxID=152421 RepID=A0AAV5JXU5_9ROSI|nr:hypothetical protein SLEP1_g25886 [Rubroshorea leprosula]
MVLWPIWSERNNNVFRGGQWNAERVFEFIQIKSFNWIKRENGGISFYFKNGCQGSERTGREYRIGQRKPSSGYGKGVLEQATPFFVTKFQDEWEMGEMWKAFVKDTRAAELQLNQIRIGQRTLEANLARFSMEDTTRKSENLVVSKSPNGNRYKKGLVQGNVASSKEEGNHSEEEWDMQASCATMEIEAEIEANQVALLASNRSRVDYSKNWIIDSGATSHMTGDEDKVKNVFHVSRMIKNLLSMSQLIALGNYVVFRPKDVKVYQQLKIEGTPIMKGEKWDFVYVMFAETAYVGKTSKNDTFDLWHARLGHISYLRLQVMMNKSMMKGLPKLELHKDVVCASCQYGKAHQLPYQDSKFKAKEPLQLVHLDVFGKVKLSSIGGAHYMVTFIDDYLRTKFDKKAVRCRCIFLGYDDQRKGWRCCDPNTRRWYVSRNVVFDEASFWRSPQEVVLPDSKELEEEVQEKLGEDTCRLLDTQEVVEKEKEIPLERTVNPWQTGLRRFTRELKPNPMYANIALIEASPITEPKNYEEAAQSVEWRKALEKEIKALMPNQTWELVPKPNDVKLVSCKWVYKVKTRLDKKIERYKARLVARGFS